jgi:hypothetical protein
LRHVRHDPADLQADPRLAPIFVDLHSMLQGAATGGPLDRSMISGFVRRLAAFARFSTESTTLLRPLTRRSV